MAKKQEPIPQGKQTPYVGCIEGTGQPLRHESPHALISAPTGSGKTLRLLVPGALFWRGPRVIISSKTDFLMRVVTHGRIQDRGPLYVMDLAGELDPSFEWLQGIDYQMVVSDPCSLIENDDDALAMASLLMKVGALGASDGGDAGGGNDAFWQTLAAQPLAALLQAGKASGEGIGWAVQAAAKAEADEDDDNTPSWPYAYDLIKDTSRHAPDLMTVAGMDAKLKDSLTATMKSGLTPWLLSNVRGYGHDVVPFSPSMLEGPYEPTLAIVAPADGVAAGAAVGAVETIIRHWRRGIERGLDRILLSVDEAVNTCPLPKLPTYITEARGLGVACVIAVQSTNQMQLRWGETGAKVLREVFPAAVILPGAPEREMLENAAWWDGEEDVLRDSVGADQKKSSSYERLPRTHATDLLPREKGYGRLLLFGQKGHKVELPGIWEFGQE